ncbi:VOC family protein [Dactylosporangium sp. CA-092794]|uniref:VOC family protein n=1 Tax=Dactylosporangium sp. CA-092794 TaxID=3239929 RepID=UPI003D8EE346
MPLHRLTKLTVAVPDVAGSTDFYRDFGLDHLGAGRFATADGGEQLELVARPRRGLVELGLGCDDPDDLDRIAANLTGADHAFQRTPEAVVTTDEGSGVRVRVTISPRYDQTPPDEPRVNAPGADRRRDERAPGSMRAGQVRPRRLGHVVVGSVDTARSEHLFIDLLGFQVSDTVRHVGKFVRCSTDHHNLMVAAAPARFLHHTSWQVDDVDEVGRGAAHMVTQDRTRHVWGLGRHNVGGNFFWYLRDPAGNFAEYYSDLDIITERLRWDALEWRGRSSQCAWAPPPPRDFHLPDDVAELMMRGEG